IEPIAAGDVRAGGRIAAHLDSCPDCRAALDSARRLDQLLRARPIPKPSSRFTERTMAVLRRNRWRSEQYLDTSVNIALVAGALTIVVALWLLLTRSGLVTLGNDAVDLVSAGFVALLRRVAPSLPIYAGATALLVMALAVWWWAERDATM